MEREYRAVGIFSAAQVRDLAPGPLDAIALGCPPALFERMLASRAAYRRTHSEVELRKLVNAPRVCCKPVTSAHEPYVAMSDEELRLAINEEKGIRGRTVGMSPLGWEKLR